MTDINKDTRNDKSISNLVDAVFGVAEDENGQRIEPSILSRPDLLPSAHNMYQEILATLTPREEKVIKMRFGIDTKQHTQKETGQHFAVTLYRIRQIEAKALRKLRHPTRADIVREFLKQLYNPQPRSVQSLAELNFVIEKVKKLTPELISHLQIYEDDLIKIDPYVFEHLIGEFFKSWGFTEVRLVGKNPKTSADIYATQIVDPLGVEIRYFIEVKRWKDRVGIGVINQVLGAFLGEKSELGWHKALIITVGGFTDLEKWNQQELFLKGIDLKGKNDLVKWLRDYKRNENGLYLPNPQNLI